MPRLDFSVTVNSGDKQADVEYLITFRETVLKMQELAAWGYTGDEAFTTSSIEINGTAERVYNQDESDPSNFNAPGTTYSKSYPEINPDANS